MTLFLKELAIAKVENIITEEEYNEAFNVLKFKVNGETTQVHITSKEYEVYNALLKIYQHKKYLSLSL